jgi:hypothetical protein
LFSPPHTRRSGMCRFCLFFRWFFICSWFYLLLQTHMALQFQTWTTRSQFPLSPTSEGFFLTWVFFLIEPLRTCMFQSRRLHLGFWSLLSPFISVYFALNLEYGLVYLHIWKRYCEVLF